MCKAHNIAKAFGKAGDMIDSLTGGSWMMKWQIRVVQAVVTQAAFMGTNRAKIFCIAGGPNCDQEMAVQPKLVRAIKQEMGNEFRTRIEWMEMDQFREQFTNAVPGSLPSGWSAKNAAPLIDLNEDLVSKSASVKAVSQGNVCAKAATIPCGSTAPPIPRVINNPTSSSQPHNDSSQHGQNISSGVSRMEKNEFVCECGRRLGSFDGLCQHQDATGCDELEDYGELVCEECEGNFFSANALIQHQNAKNHNGVRFSFYSDDGYDSGSERKIDHLSSSLAGLSLNQGVASTKASTHFHNPSSPANNNSSDTNMFVCECGRRLGSFDSLRQHQDATGCDELEDHGELICEECERNFFSVNALTQHQNAKNHNGARFDYESDDGVDDYDTDFNEFVCECGRRLGSFDSLRQHQDATGCDELRGMLVCEECDRNFFSTNALTQHQNAKNHNGVRFDLESDDGDDS